MTGGLLLVVALGCVVFSCHTINRHLFRNRNSSFLIICLLALYAIPVALGALTVLSPLSLVLACAALVPCSLVANRLPGSRRRARDHPRVRPVAIGLRRVSMLAGVEWAALVVLCYMLAPLTQGIAARVEAVHDFEVDVTAYHLPNTIDIVQSGSMWTARGPFPDYPMGYEVYQMWGLIFLHSDALMGLTHMMFFLTLLCFSCAVLRLLAGSVKRDTVMMTAAYCALTVLFILLLGPMILGFGLNDLAVNALTMASLYFMVRIVHANRASREDLVLLGISIGLIAAIKPTGLLFCLLVVVVLVTVRFRATTPSVRSLLLVPLFTLMVSLFWYIRAVVVAGLHGEGLDRSIAANLLERQLYRWDSNTEILLAAALVAIVLIVRRHRLNRQWQALAYTLVGSLAIFVITPFSAYGSWPYEPIQIRLALGVAPVVCVLIIALLLAVVDRIATATALRVVRISWPGSALRWISCVLVGVALLAQATVYRMPDHLSDYPYLWAGAPTAVYGWVADHIENRVIYSIGLRPYGLYGHGYGNKVFVTSAATTDGWLDDIRRFGPDYMVLPASRPFVPAGIYSANLRKLPQMTNCFAPVYGDGQALVYRILPKARLAPIFGSDGCSRDHAAAHSRGGTGHLSS
jgi:hypothetical protein